MTASSVPDNNTVENETSVSALLSSFYDVDAPKETNSGNSQSDSNNESQASSDDGILSGAIFGDADFDVDRCLTTALKKYSMVELIGLLRRLEREVRQFTAGKQILIYDNYECLFTALDTVHEINSDLAVVQKRLQALKSSQIKASTVDVSSRYGFREKLRGITELNRVIGIFQALSCVVACLNEATQSPPADMDQKGHLLTSVGLLAKVYVILEAVQKRSGPKAINLKLLHNIGKTTRQLVTSVVKDIYVLVKSESLTHNLLVLICCHLAMARMNAIQLWDLYWLNKSLCIRQRIKHLYDKVKDRNVDLQGLSNELVQCLDYIVEAVNSDGYSKLAQSIQTYCHEPENDADCSMNIRNVSCLFCCTEGCDVTIVEEDHLRGCLEYERSAEKIAANYVYSHFFASTSDDSHCKCVKDDMPRQFAVLYTQLAFAVFKSRIIDQAKRVSSNELIYVLTCLLDRLNNMTTDSEIIKLVKDISFGWMLLIVLLYMQKLFYPIYEALATVIQQNTETAVETDIYSGIYGMVERVMKDDVADLFRFVEELGTAMQTPLRPLFTSFLSYYVLSLKAVFSVRFRVLLAFTGLNDVAKGCLGSVVPLVALRSNTEASIQKQTMELIDESKEGYRRIKSKRSIFGPDLDEDTMDSDLLSIITGISVEHFMERMIRKKVAKVTPTINTVRSLLTHMVTLLIPFMGVFDRIINLVDSQLGAVASIMIKTGELTMTLPQNTISSREYHSVINGNLCPPNLLDDYVEGNFMESLLRHWGIHLTGMTYAVYCLGQTNVTHILFPVIMRDKSEIPGIKTFSHKNDVFCFDTPQVILQMLSHVMICSIRSANMLIRFAAENMEDLNNASDDLINDFVGLLYELIEFLNATADPTISGETTYTQMAEMNRKLKNIVSKGDIGVLHILSELTFVPSKDLCLKLFTIHVAQCIAQVAKLHVVKRDVLSLFVTRVQKQIIMAFKKSSDAKQMKSLFEQLVNSVV
ncbi:vacuolar sorting-associated protein, putative [Babesia ovis]|uniref:Vacuolar sorting-associated protein, putative n=1 Tax=Babesia ovis TaxID=5869 RepID=A0A9W5TCL0_BABOV|nr:vacuolar sorting-associated protein, putative [Babesia ovis]